MTDNSLKVSQLPTAANVAASDRVVILRNPSESPSLRTVNVDIFSANLIISNTVPANSTSNGITGTITRDNNYIYVCVANNTWKRTELSGW